MAGLGDVLFGVERAGELAERELVAGRRPCGGFGEQEIDLVGDFARIPVRVDVREGDVMVLGISCGHVETVVGMPDLMPVFEEPCGEHVAVGAGEQVAVLDGHAVPVGGELDRRIQLLDLLRLGAGRAVGEHDAVAHEFVVGWTVAPFSADAEAFAPVGQTLDEPLVDVIPDEPAGVALVPFEVDELAQTAARVAHGMHVLTADERLARPAPFVAVFEPVLDLGRLGVHTAFEVADPVVGMVPVDTFVVDGTTRIKPVRVCAHGLEDFARVGFVAQRPDEHAGMVAVAQDHAVQPVDARAQPGLVVTGDGGSHGDVAGAVPAAMGLQIGLVDQVDAVFVAQLVPA